MNDPGDYYRRKQKEVDDAQFELAYHELNECKGDYFCKRCSALKAKLELARYVGD